MESYYALIRGLVRGNPPDENAERAEGAAAVYRTLVRQQHRQVLVQLFEPIRALLGESNFERLVDRVRCAAPPRDPNPGRWVDAVAVVLEADPGLDDLTRALAAFLALRCKAQLAEDTQWTTGLRPNASLAAFACDPRVGLAARYVSAATRPCILAIFRDDAGCVRTPALSPQAVAAWGLAAGETDQAFLSSAGVDEAAVTLGREQLRALGVWRP
jgi:hypothetical protein